MPIDYSKWDHLDEYSDSDENEEQNTTPRVTRLDAPSRVTFGGSSNKTADAIIEPQISSDVKPAATSSTAAAIPEESPTQSSSPIQAWTTKGGLLRTPDNRRLYWCQDRYSVQIRLELHREPKESIECVQVEGILSYADRHCATGSHKHRLIITGDVEDKGQNSKSSTITLLEGDLPHPVHLSQDDGNEAGSLDWTVERHPENMEQRFVLITLYKAVPMLGIFVWWKRPLLQFEETVLDDNDTNRSAASKEFLQAWDEAHKIFREKKRPVPQSLPD